MALQLFEVCKTWATPNTISYNAAIPVCDKGGQWQHAFALLKTMRSRKMWPIMSSYNAAISACAKGSCR